MPRPPIGGMGISGGLGGYGRRLSRETPKIKFDPKKRGRLGMTGVGAVSGGSLGMRGSRVPRQAAEAIEGRFNRFTETAHGVSLPETPVARRTKQLHEARRQEALRRAADRGRVSKGTVVRAAAGYATGAAVGDRLARPLGRRLAARALARGKTPEQADARELAVRYVGANLGGPPGAVAAVRFRKALPSLPMGNLPRTAIHASHGKVHVLEYHGADRFTVLTKRDRKVLVHRNTLRFLRDVGKADRRQEAGTAAGATAGFLAAPGRPINPTGRNLHPLAHLGEGVHQVDPKTLLRYSRGTGVRFGERAHVARIAHTMRTSGYSPDAPPVRLAVHTDRAQIRDGMHRAHAAGVAGLKTVPVEIKHSPHSAPTATRAGQIGDYLRNRVQTRAYDKHSHDADWMHRKGLQTVKPGSWRGKWNASRQHGVGTVSHWLPKPTLTRGKYRAVNAAMIGTGAAVGHRALRRDVEKADRTYGYEESKRSAPRTLEMAGGLGLLAYGVPRLKMLGPAAQRGLKLADKHGGGKEARAVLSLAQKVGQETKALTNRGESAIRQNKTAAHVIDAVPYPIRGEVATALGALTVANAHPTTHRQFTPA